MAQPIIHSAAPQRYVKSSPFVYGQLLGTQTGTEIVPLHDPVKFAPPPPAAPPVTHWNDAFSGVPAWSPLFTVHAFWWVGLTLSML